MSLCRDLTRSQSIRFYDEVLRHPNNAEALRRLCREDLFFLLLIGCGRIDISHDWLYDRCREVEQNPNSHLDLWSREHYKSTIITFALTIQDILNDPEVTVGIFSHTRPIAKSFLDQIKREFESNKFLINLFPDVLHKEPAKESQRWSLDGGIIVKRQTNPKEATVEAWGLVDGQPIGKHFNRLIYDDVVTRDSINTPDQIAKTTESWELSLNLGAHGGAVRYIGTRYHYNDTYRTIMERSAATPRIYPATEDGEVLGKPVFLTADVLAQKRREMGPYTFGCQMLQNPTADKSMGFREDWIRYYVPGEYQKDWNYYILVDPANEKTKKSDYTVMLVVATAPDGNYYLIDGVRDRLNLTERTKQLFKFVIKYRPICTGYEKYGIQSDDQHIKYIMGQLKYHFDIKCLGGGMAKNDRIRKLVPLFEQGRIYLPHTLYFVDVEGTARDLVDELIKEEYSAFPVAIHDDIMDCLARVEDEDLGLAFPRLQDGLIFATVGEHGVRQSNTAVCAMDDDPLGDM